MYSIFNIHVERTYWILIWHVPAIGASAVHETKCTWRMHVMRLDFAFAAWLFRTCDFNIVTIRDSLRTLVKHYNRIQPVFCFLKRCD
jgi:hypothetical protein